MKNTAVIMSIYKSDRLQFVEESVQSILRQTYRQFDFYIIADGEIDNAIEKFLSNINDDRVFFTKRSQNMGLAKSLNELLRMALPKGYEYIGRMDADDISMPDRFAKQLAFLEENKDTDIVGTWAIEIDEFGNVFYEKKMPIDHHGCYEQFKKRDCIIHPTAMFRRTYFEKAGMYPENTYFAEDTMMWANGFVNGCRFANIPEFLFRFRIDQDFFKRRRGWKHALNIYKLRRRVNRLLNYPASINIYAMMYAVAKMMPTPILNIIYKTTR